MCITFLPITECDYDKAIDLVWQTFMKFEAPDYNQNGINQFRKTVVDNIEYKKKCITGEHKLIGAYIENKIVGVICIKNECHISLFFVKDEYQRKGIGRKLFENMLENLKTDIITVNSSPYAVNIYSKLGFVNTDKEKEIEGIRFTPMKYINNI